jgi:hypothetical protein
VGQGGKSLPEENEQRSDRRLAERLILSPQYPMMIPRCVMMKYKYPLSEMRGTRSDMGSEIFEYLHKELFWE